MAQTRNGQIFGPPNFPYIFEMAFDVSDNLEYAGFAATGVPTSTPAWKIMKFTYSGNNLISGRLANAGEYDQIWDNYLSLDYA